MYSYPGPHKVRLLFCNIKDIIFNLDCFQSHFKCYSYNRFYFKIVLEALPKDETNQGRRYRGYVAVDNLVFESGDVSYPFFFNNSTNLNTTSFKVSSK